MLLSSMLRISLVVYTVLCDASASNILMIPYPIKSLTRIFAKAGKDLESRGHKVHVLVEDVFRPTVDQIGVSALTYEQDEDATLTEEDALSPVDRFKAIHMETAMRNKLCETIHSNADFIARMKSLEFDLVLIEGFVSSRCFYSIPYRLGVRYVTLTGKNHPWNAGIPALPASEPVFGLGRGFLQESTLYDRAKDLMTNILIWLYMPPKVLDDSIISRFCPNRPLASFDELYKKSEMWLINLDQICLDDPTIYAPHYQIVAGLGLSEPEPLPCDLESYVQSAPNGVIVFTLGSLIERVPNEMLIKLLDAFRRLDYRFIMRHSNATVENVPDNVKLLAWLPQSDLLAHPKTRAFITHAGGNGQLEAVYHGVPMISLPVFADQNYNAHRVALKGYGVTLDRHTFTSDEALEAIHEVATSKLYRDNIKRCSDRFRSLPLARDTVAFWVEHVIKYGGEHLRPTAIDVPIWKLFMLDIVCLVVFLILLIYSCGIFVCVKMYGKLGKK